VFVTNISSAVREIIFMNSCLLPVQGVTFGTNIRVGSKHQNNENSSKEKLPFWVTALFYFPKFPTWRRTFVVASSTLWAEIT
jgi:hypothetical protein